MAARLLRAIKGGPARQQNLASPFVCPGREPAFLAVERPARPYKSPIQNRFTSENARARLTAPRAAPDDVLEGLLVVVRDEHLGGNGPASARGGSSG
jgi:hypothetical protein